MLTTAYRVLVFYGTLACFGVFVLGFNACWALAPVRPDGERERRLQRTIHGVFRRLTKWLRVAGLLEIQYRGFERLPQEGCVIVANHPGLLDAVFLLARIPTAFCVFKPSIRRNPLFGPVAVRAGYLPNDHGLALVRSAAARIRAGSTFLVFPEGTRTAAGQAIGPFKPGFALIARRAGSPVQLVRITVNGSLMTKERAWWKVPSMPARLILEVGPRFDAAKSASTAELVAATEAWFRGGPVDRGPTPDFEASPPPSPSLRLTAS